MSRVTKFLCINCNIRKANQSRRLCNKCYTIKSIRDLYPTKSTLIHSEASSLEEQPIVLPKKPTKHLPGTIGKIRVMKRRIAEGHSAFHPNDARLTLQ